jgi:ribosomal protein L40E
MEEKRFYGPNIIIQDLAQSLETWYIQNDFQTQIVPSEDGSIFVQARKDDWMRKITGMATTLTTIFHKEGDYIRVEIGQGSWLDKAVVGAASWFIFPPTMITAGIGLYEQTRLRNKSLQFIQEYIDFGSERAIALSLKLNLKPVPMKEEEQPDQILCQECQQPLSGEAKFCRHCGAPVEKFCANCGQKNIWDAKFCEHCGSQFG